MVLDTSAIIEIFIDGPEAAKMRSAMKAARGHRFMSAANLLEAHIVMRRRHAQAAQRTGDLLDRLIARYGIAIEAVQESHTRLAITAYDTFGKGAGGGALNFGDCFAYALAKQRSDTLLFVGDDFRRTDIRAAVN